MFIQTRDEQGLGFDQQLVPGPAHGLGRAKKHNIF